MEAPTHFADFLGAIRPTEPQRNRMRDSHATLRGRLEADEALRPIILGTFIQGSYRRHTGIKATPGFECDVDVVVVTNLPKTQATAAYTLELFRPFLERHYRGSYKAQDRSWCISVDTEVKLDLVPTAEPGEVLRELVAKRALDEGDFASFSEAAADVLLKRAAIEAKWKTDEPLWIPDRERYAWDRTHPLAQIKWTAEKNLRGGGHFVNVVKVIKWWKRHSEPQPKYPKGYPLEHLVGDCCPDEIPSVAKGLVDTLEGIHRKYTAEAAAAQTPNIADRALPENNVFARIPGDFFAEFHRKVGDASRRARAALEDQDFTTSVARWRDLLGSEFPQPPPGGFTPRSGPSRISSKGRFA